MENEKEIIILSVTKTREGKSVLEYLTETIGESEYRVGYIVRQDWREDPSWFELKNHIGKRALVKVGYNTLSNGRIYERILDVLKLNDEKIFKEKK